MPSVKKMVYPIAIRYVSTGIEIEHEGEYGVRWFEGQDCFQLMQSTGLYAAKSYRGESEEDRLIWEGDIVAALGITGVVSWKYGQWNIIDSNSLCSLYETTASKCEIIGTVFDKQEGA